MARTQEQRKAETRSRLLDAAADLFARRGFHGVSAESLADEADRTTGALYSHFGGKEGVLVALLEERTQAVSDRILARVREADDLDTRLRALWTQSADRDGDGTWSLLEVELLLLGARDPLLAELVRDRYAVARAQLGDALASWVAESGEASPHDTDRAGALVIALLLGLSLLQRVDPETVTTSDVVRGLHALVASTSP